MFYTRDAEGRRAIVDPDGTLTVFPPRIRYVVMWSFAGTPNGWAGHSAHKTREEAEAEAERIRTKNIVGVREVVVDEMDLSKEACFWLPVPGEQFKTQAIVVLEHADD